MYSSPLEECICAANQRYKFTSPPCFHSISVRRRPPKQTEEGTKSLVNHEDGEEEARGHKNETGRLP